MTFPPPRIPTRSAERSAPRTVQALGALFIGLATVAAVIGVVWDVVVRGNDTSINSLGYIAAAGLGLLGGALGFRRSTDPSTEEN